MPRKQFCRKRSGTVIESKLKRHEQDYAGLHKRGVRFKIHRETSSPSSALTRVSAGPVLETTGDYSRGRLTK